MGAFSGYSDQSSCRINFYQQRRGQRLPHHLQHPRRYPHLRSQCLLHGATSKKTRESRITIEVSGMSRARVVITHLAGSRQIERIKKVDVHPSNHITIKSEDAQDNSNKSKASPQLKKRRKFRRPDVGILASMNLRLRLLLRHLQRTALADPPSCGE